LSQTHSSQPAPTIRQTPTTECTMRPPCYRSLRLCIRRSDSLEFTARQSSRFDCWTGPVSTRELKTHLFACLLNTSSTVR